MHRIHLRPAISPPIYDHPPPTTNKRIILFKHPAYPEDFDQNVLLQLYAWDIPTGGLHSGTALLACALIACNAWDGYLTIERDGQKLDLHEDDILTAQEYYFHVPEFGTTSAGSGNNHNCYKYPIYPSFQHWAFPHRHTPSHWSGSSGDETDSASNEPSSTPSVSSASAAVIARDKACAISKHSDYMERAHLCPRNELEWFQRNGMRRYNARLDISGDVITDDTSNALALRADIHRAFDGGKFAFARKGGFWVPHFFETTHELGRMYHNRPVELTAGVAPEFMLTRFAYAVFPLIKAFMEHGPERLVKVREQHEGELREVVKTLDPAGFAKIAGTYRGRSASPKKRRASDTLPSIVETKKRCSNSAHDLYHQIPNVLYGWAENAKEQHTPNLLSDDGMSSQSLSTAAPKSLSLFASLTGREVDADYISSLRRRELRKRRPTNPDILCCNYSFAEDANALGLPGKPEYGGGHLCEECLGSERLLNPDQQESSGDDIYENG